MAPQQTTNAFHQVLIRSGLLREELIRKLTARFPVESSNAEQFASLLITKRLITKWQADKLLLGKHRGFFLGPYQLKSHLARGGMSTLYVAQHTKTGDVRALKVLPPAKAAEASYLPRFLREAELASRLHHTNVMQVFDILSFSDAGQTVHFMVMELLHGRDLFNEVTQRGPLPVKDACDIIRQAADGLQYAHEAGLVHRDIKPGNLFLTEEGVVKIVDLGLAAILEGQAESLTREYDERVLGTADYLAPEQAVDSHTVDGRADIYALGCAFYFALSGRPPFVDGNLAQRILAHQTKDPQDISEIRGDVPQQIQYLLKAMLKKNRDARIQTCSEIAAELSGWLKSSGDEARFSQKPTLLEPRDPAETSSRKLRRLAPKKSQSETPTDSIRAAETSTTRPDESQEQNSSVWQSAGGYYSEAFECFLERLDNESGVASVMDDSFRREQRRAMSHLPADVVADVPDESANPIDFDECTSLTADSEASSDDGSLPETPASRRMFGGIALVVVAVGVSAIALTIGRPWAAQLFQFLRQVLHSVTAD